LSTSTAQPAWVNWGRAWGIFFLAVVFGVGGFFLFDKSIVDWNDVLREDTASTLVLGILYAVFALVGLVKGEIIFRRKILARALSRARSAIGATGWAGDVPLAPFCMLSMYRPWKPAHAISSWVIIPLMVGLAIFFRVGLPSMIGAEAGALVRGPVYFGIGLALAYGAAVYIVALMRFVGWWLNDGQPETVPLPEQGAGARGQGPGIRSQEPAATAG
jgi:uncharacterized membrane protein